jgi:hypothetical protein
MAQFLLSVHHTVKEARPSDEEIQQMFADVKVFNDKVRDAGKWVFAGGLEGIESATTVDATGQEPVVTDGPFAESKEYLGGFWVIESADLDEALSWATQGSAACGGKVEVRPFQSE